MPPSSHSILAVALLVSITACVRRGGAPVAHAGAQGSLPLGAAEGPIEETNQPSASFLLEGEPFCFAGTNSYYPMYKSRKMVDDLLDATRRLGLRVIRIWAYLDRGSLDGTVPNADGPGDKEGVYFQYWDPVLGRPAYNDSETGIAHLDYVLDKAAELGLRVIVVLTNNWRDFGGMDQYLMWYGLVAHHQFYTDPRVARAYEDWVAHLIAHKNTISGVLYRDDPTIFAWELANEPRCNNASPFDHRAECSASMIVQWSRRMSDFIKSLDPNHLVSVGDEGFFAGGRGFGRDGAEGVDHAALLAVDHIDFGTYHLYPDNWGQPLAWAGAWIEDHIEAARQAGKPTVLEEYGVIARRDRAGLVVDEERRAKAYPRWHEVIEKRGGNGALFWMLGGYDDDYGRYPDYDHFVLYADDALTTLIRAFATEMPLESRACSLYRQFARPGGARKSPFVTVGKPPGWAQTTTAAL
jgi:mannan endo-1,4-beta-mannosidase